MFLLYLTGRRVSLGLFEFKARGSSFPALPSHQHARASRASWRSMEMQALRKVWTGVSQRQWMFRMFQVRCAAKIRVFLTSPERLLLCYLLTASEHETGSIASPLRAACSAKACFQA